MQFYDLANQSLAKNGSSIVEEYIPLWFADGSYSSISGGVQTGYVQDGTQGVAGNTTGTATKLHTLNSNWSLNQKYALEVSIYSDNASYTATVQLWDTTSNTAVSGSSISTTATTATVLRSSQFTLTPGHSYGIQLTTSSSSGIVYVPDASLIVFGQ